MTKKIYHDHIVELTSQKTDSGEWVARATILVGDGKANKQIPILGRRRATFETRRQANAYALELAKLWIDGRRRGANGRG